MITVGERLPDQVIALIKNSSTPDERREVCIKQNSSIGLMNSLLRKDRNITEENKKLIDKVVAKCKKNIQRNLKLLQSITN